MNIKIDLLMNLALCENVKPYLKQLRGILKQSGHLDRKGQPAKKAWRGSILKRKLDKLERLVK